MTKIQVQINQEFDYYDYDDEPTSQEVLIFSTPDDFCFDSKLGVEFFKTPEVKQKFKIRDAVEKNGEIYLRTSEGSTIYTSIPIMLEAGRFQDDFVEWLETTKNVILLDYNMIGQEF